jgi:hypothetical protein
MIEVNHLHHETNVLPIKQNAKMVSSSPWPVINPAIQASNKHPLSKHHDR